MITHRELKIVSFEQLVPEDINYIIVKYGKMFNDRHTELLPAVVDKGKTMRQKAMKRGFGQ